jgi:hypothetical protein
MIGRMRTTFVPACRAQDHLAAHGKKEIIVSAGTAGF